MIISSLTGTYGLSLTQDKGIAALIITGFIIVIALIVIAVRNPYRGPYPYCNIRVDISRKRNVDYMHVIDTLLWKGCDDPSIPLNKSNCTALSQRAIEDAQQAVIDWERWVKQDIEHRWTKKRRQKQYLAVADYDHTFCFTFVRQQTKYKQVNYVRHPYVEQVVYQRLTFSYPHLIARIKRLQKTGYASVDEKEVRRQRSRMTQDLRKQIMERDNYTCQICGKYMPDCVGLEIDHIVPVSKGGRTEPKNLQVLCSVCNRRKSNK